MQATVTSKGQVTIPAEIRERLGLKAQDKVTFTEMPDGTVVMRAKNKSLLDFKGLDKAPKRRKVRTEDMSFGSV